MINKDRHEDYETCSTNKSKGIILACGQGSGIEFLLQNDPQAQIAHVTIDLSHLIKPKVLIDFSSIISFFSGGSGIENQFRFELFRVCDNEAPVLLGNWVFERRDTGGSTDTSVEKIAFNFNFCDCVKYPGCCQYFVVVRPLLFSGIPVTIDNARITAIAQSSSD
ncbi:DUF4489 domain-containing protein [Vallitalea okinawensis]|uniref:DUF4489 domain-containing protein n=1 Tax=Vallitalea okinawensis TaxID=2078660 RepID=UPI000CFBFF2C|nr:DUF4489 domain-containing protein [Vallitalea okinawensis]